MTQGRVTQQPVEVAVAATAAKARATQVIAEVLIATTVIASSDQPWKRTPQTQWVRRP